ncbi:MAG: primosomal protein N' [Thiotrichales bacterium]|nr:primosomal protein N' [Thiotrichales bacterium]
MTASEPILRVAVPVPVRHPFDYLPPRPGSAPPVRPGARVRVPFGRTSAVGVVLGITRASAVDARRLKRVREVIDPEPLLDPAMLKLLLWASGYFHHPVGEVVVGTLPKLLRLGRAPKAERTVRYVATAAGAQALAEGLGGAPVQRRLLGVMVGAGSVPEAELVVEHRDWRRPMRALIAKDWAQPVPDRPDPPLPSDRPILNPAQSRAVEAVEACLGEFGPFVLDGVTGSGKTEVYLRLIAAAVARGRQALVLIPEIGLTPQLLARFNARLSCRVVALHSGLSDGERLSSWTQARDGTADVLVGTRSAVFAPLARPGLFIVDEEHDLSFKQQDGFRYSARDLAVVRARDAGAPIVLGSATPSLEAIENVRRGRYRRLDLPHRAGGATPPRIDVIDLRARPFDSGLCDVLVEALEQTKARSEQALLFINRRGYAPRLMCHACGWIADCDRCDAHLVLHREEGRMRCHHCAAERPIVSECPACGSKNVRRLGLGTERVASALEKRITGLRVARMDRDATRRRGSLEALLDRVHAGEVDAVVGTQMLAKGHHFPNVTLVAILDADAGLFGIDFRATERMAQLLLQVAGRAGRGDRTGRVLLQTHHPKHPLLRVLVQEGYRKFCAEALTERHGARLPPFASLALVRAEALQRDAPQSFLRDAEACASAHPQPGVSVLGPVPSPMERRAGRYRAQLLVDATSRAALQRFLPEWIAALESLPSARKVRWSIDVDPQEMV